MSSIEWSTPDRYGWCTAIDPETDLVVTKEPEVRTARLVQTDGAGRVIDEITWYWTVAREGEAWYSRQMVDGGTIRTRTSARMSFRAARETRAEQLRAGFFTNAIGGEWGFLATRGAR